MAFTTLETARSMFFIYLEKSKGKIESSCWSSRCLAWLWKGGILPLESPMRITLIKNLPRYLIPTWTVRALLKLCKFASRHSMTFQRSENEVLGFEVRGPEFVSYLAAFAAWVGSCWSQLLCLSSFIKLLTLPTSQEQMRWWKFLWITEHGEHFSNYCYDYHWDWK